MTAAYNEPSFVEMDGVPALSPLQAAVARARALLHRRILWLAHLENVAEGETDLEGTLRRALLDSDNPEEEERFALDDARAKALTARAARFQTAALAPLDSPFRRLVEAFGLLEHELDLLQFCAVIQLDPTLGILLERVTQPSERRYPTEPVIARVYGHGRRVLRTPMGALNRWHLILEEQGYTGEAPPLRIDPFVQAYLAGAREFDPSVWSFSQVVPVRTPLPSWHVQDLCADIDQLLSGGASVRVTTVGPENSGRRTLAACVAQYFGATVFAVDTTCIDETTFAVVVRRARRQALLHGSVIAWLGTSVERVFWREHPLLPLEFVVLDRAQEIPTVSQATCVERHVEMPRLTAVERLKLWRELYPSSRDWPEETATRISERFSVQVGDIAHVANQESRTFARNDQACANQNSNGFEAVEAALRGLNRGKLGTLATLVPCPFRRGDLELSTSTSQQLDELLFEASERGPFWDDPRARRLFPRGTGLVALFSGPPGTGKTMAAQVVAAELGLDLFRIDIASMVSKYIGETAKNLKQLFSRAAEMDSVLLFDEADALFAKRAEVRDAHDKHANADLSYLLQLVEGYPGIAVLATNRRQNMDDAFVRRIRYVLHFERPEPQQRHAIWHQVLNHLSSEEHIAGLTPELESIAQAVDITGAQIKNAALAAAFLARSSRQPISLAHIHRGLERELRNQGRELMLKPQPKGGKR